MKRLINIIGNILGQLFAFLTRFFKILLIILIIGLASLFAYDFYMRNSGFKNRLDYEIQKQDFKNQFNDYDLDYRQVNPNNPINKLQKSIRKIKEKRKKRRNNR
tara:strand:+ start:2337 stop:2648 length:312 start_codon:yes stop_codon:yes gene_type:complete